MKYVTNIERRGRAEGRTEGRTEGRAEALRDAVLEVLETRFGETPYDLREAVTAVDDLARLKQWHRLAIQLPSLEAFQAHLYKR